MGFPPHDRSIHPNNQTYSALQITDGIFCNQAQGTDIDTNYVYSVAWIRCSCGLSRPTKI